MLYALGSSAGLYFLFAELTPVKRRASAPVPVLEPVPEPVLVAVGGDVPPPVELAAPPPPPPADAEQSTQKPERGLQRVARFVESHTAWCVALALLLGASLIYTYAGTVSRETYRTTWLPENSVPFTLDGMAFMKVAYPSDYAGIRWINAHVTGAPVIAEAYSPAGYSWPSRVSMFTGLPDIFNGIHEQTEQRYGDEVDRSSLCSTAPHPDACFARVHSRQDDLTTLYNSPRPQEAWRVIRTYGVKYIYVGWSETHCQQERGEATEWHGSPH